MANQDNGFTAPTWNEYKASFSAEWREMAYVLWPWWVALQFGGWYSQTFFARSLRVFEPLGIAVAVVALGFTWFELQEAERDRKIAAVQREIAAGDRQIEKGERRREQALREATLFAMASERLDAARQSDRSNNVERPSSRKGQRRLLEAMAEINANMTGIDASRTYLLGGFFYQANIPVSDFKGAFLYGSQFENANLRGAKFESADLRRVIFTGANLLGAKFSKANMRLAELDRAHLEFADLREALNLTQTQLDEACGNSYTKLPESFVIKSCVGAWRVTDDMPDGSGMR